MKFSLKRLDGYKSHLVMQTLLAIVYVAVMIFLLTLVSSPSSTLWAIGAGALASSTYIVFVTPHAANAEPRRIISGYFVSLLIGSVMRVILLKVNIQIVHISDIHSSHIFWTISAVTVGITILLMIMLHSEHPPAVGVSMVLVLHLENYAVLGVILLGAGLLALIGYMLKRWLIDLTHH
jgi:CBS-domain-containing membrane protein